MWPVAELNSTLKNELAVTQLFDFYRLVDVETYEVVEFAEGDTHLVSTHETCHHIWGDGGPCVNCTSRNCVKRHEAIVKIMHLDNQFLLIYSMPVTLSGKPYALELIKDISHSLMVPSMESGDNIEIVDMINQFNNAAARDSFTHLYNKNFALNSLDDLVGAYNQGLTDEPCALVMLDLDLFKNINDEYGHNTGDEVLLLLAKELGVLAIKFEGGWAARYGGDEFLLCAPKGLDSDGEQKIIASLESFAADVEKNLSFLKGATVSYGIAVAQKGDDARGLIERADQEMYKMKEVHHVNMA